MKNSCIILFLLQVLCSVFLFPGCTHQQIQREACQSLQGKINQKIDCLNLDCLLYQEDASKYLYYHNRREEIHNIQTEWERLDSEGIPFTYNSLMALLNAENELPEVERWYAWTKYCSESLVQIKLCICDLESLTTTLESAHNGWEVQRINATTYIVSGYGLGLDQDEITYGSWSFCTPDKSVKPYDMASAKLWEKMNHMEMAYAEARQKYGL